MNVVKNEDISCTCLNLSVADSLHKWCTDSEVNHFVNIQFLKKKLYKDKINSSDIQSNLYIDSNRVNDNLHVHNDSQ